MKLKHLALASAFIILCINVMAQGKVTGKVSDGKSGNAVEYATITLHKTSDSSLVGGATSGTNGGFEIKNVAYGEYILKVSFMGYKTYFHPTHVKLTPQAAQQNVGKIAINPSATTLKAAEIVAERSMVEYQLDKRVINVDKNLVASGGTATDILENVPSVAIDNDGNVTLRGSTNVKLLINGRPYELLSSDLESLLEQIPASTVENVEVITNPSAKYDPEGMSGIINLKLKDKSTAALGLNGVVTANFGTPLITPDIMPAIIPTAMGSINLNYTTEKFNFFFSADGGRRSHGMYGHTDLTRLRNGDTISHDYRENYSIGRNTMGSFKIGGEYYINDKNSILISYQMRESQRKRTSQIFSEDIWETVHPYPTDYDQIDTNLSRSHNHTFNFNYTKKFDRKEQLLTLDATFSMRRMLGDGFQEQSYPDLIAQQNNYYLRETDNLNRHRMLNVKLNYTHPFENNMRLETGYEGQVTWANQNSKYYMTEYGVARYFDEVSSTNYLHNQQTHGVYATLGWKPFEKFSAQAGLRGELASIKGQDLNHPATAPVDKTYWQLYPTLHLSYDINKDQSVQLSYSRRVRRPHMWDLNPYLEVREGQELSFGNPNIDPEYTNSIELSYNLGIKKINIFTSAYFRQTNNMMTRYGFVWDATTAAYYSPWMQYNAEYDGYWASTWQNLNQGINYGMELIVDWQVKKWWKLNVSINLYENMIEGTDLLNGEDRNAFRASGKFTSFMNLPKDWTIQFSGQYRAPFMDLQTDMLASYWADLAVKKDILDKRATVNLRIGDVFCTGGFGHNTENEQMYRYARSKRMSPSISLGFTYKINNGLKTPKKAMMDSDDEGGDGEY